MVKIAKKYTRNYTVIDNTIWNDKKISWKAKGIFGFLWSRPDDWNFYQKEIVTHATDGEASFREGKKELIKRGYLRIERVRVNGQFKESKWTLIERPQDIKNGDKSTIPPRCDFPTWENPTQENRSLLSTDVQNTNLTNTTTTDAVAYTEDDAIDELEGLGIKNKSRGLVVAEYYAKLGPDVLKYVIQKVKYANKPDLKYMIPILEDYEKKGINTLEKAKQDDERHRQRSRKQYSGYRRNPKPRIDLTDPHRFDDM